MRNSKPTLVQLVPDEHKQKLNIKHNINNIFSDLEPIQTKSGLNQVFPFIWMGIDGLGLGGVGCRL